MKNIIYLVIAISLVCFISCERYIESRDPVRSLPSDVAVPSNVSLFVNDMSVSLSWEITDASSITQYRVYVSELENGEYVLHDSTTALSIDIEDLITNRLYFFKVAAVATSGLEGHLSDVQFAQIGVLSMVIANNTEFTNRTSVQLSFTVSNSASNVQISEDSTFADAVYEPFSGQRNFILSDGDGIKVVYARLIFNNGATNSVLLRDSIELDTEARIDSVFFLTPTNLFRPSDTIIFGLVASEISGTARVSFSSFGNIDLVDDGTGFDTVADDGIYYGWFVVPNNSNVYNATVTGNFTDEAGNNALALTSFDLININTRPEPVELLVSYTGISGDSAYFSWTRSDEPDFESYRLYTASSSTVLTNDELVTYESNVNSREFVILPPVGTSWYRIFVFDAHGETRQSENPIQLIVSP